MLFKQVDWLRPYDNWLNRTSLVWASCMVMMVAVSYLSRAPDAETLQSIIWSWKTARLPESERQRNRGLRNLFFWWALFVGIMAALYTYIIWFQFRLPGSLRQ